MRPRIVKAVFLKELREMLRDRRSLAIMFGIPLLVYPLMTVGLSSLGTTRKNELENQRYRIAVVNETAAPKLTEELRDPEGSFRIVQSSDPRAALGRGEIHAVVEVPPDAQAKALEAEPVEIAVTVDESRTATAFVKRKLESEIDHYERWIVEQRLAQHGVSPTILNEVTIATTDIATSEARLGLKLAQMLPVLLLVTGTLGALFPALNATTSERELGTLETLLVSPASRMELLIAKGALVLLCGLLTAGLNMASMSLVLWHVLSMLGPNLGELQISIGALLLSFVAAIPTLIFFTTIVLSVGLIARNFREANAFATPVMLLPLTAVALSILEPETSPGLLVTPVANTTLIIRDVLTGRGTWEAFGLAFASSCVYAGLMLSVAARLFSNEQLVNPAWEPVSMNLFRLNRCKENRPRPRRIPAVDEAIALFSVVLLLFFYLGPAVIDYGLVAILSFNEIVLIGATTLIAAWVGRYRWRETFSFRAPRPAEMLAAVLVALGISPIVSLLFGLQHKVWSSDMENEKIMAELFLPWLRDHPVFIALFVGTLAGVFEELLFRGPIQASLLKRTPPWFAITAAGFLFAAIHMDLHGMPIRWGLGILLGWVVWRSGSIFPAMILHGVYDAGRIGMAAVEIHIRGAGALTTTELPPLFTARSLIELAIGTVLLIAGITLFLRAWRRRETDAPVDNPTMTPAIAPTR